jgi:hypothetical protein
LGDALEHIVHKKIADENEKLVEKLNKAFEKKEDDLRLSLSDLVKNKWLGLKPKSKGSKKKATGNSEEESSNVDSNAESVVVEEDESA